MQDKLKIVMCKSGQLATVDFVEDKLEKLQEKVDGYIEMLDLDDETTLVCNEEGKINGLPLNRTIRDENNKIVEVIAGDFFIVGLSNEDGNLKSLSEKQVEKYLKMFKYPEEIFLLNGNICATKIEPKIKKSSEKER